VGSVLLVVGEADETVDQVPSEAEGSDDDSTLVDVEADDEEAGSPMFRSGDAAPIVGTISDEAEVLTPRTERAPASADHVRALPIVRKLARDHDVDLSLVEGSGPGGRITRDDVQATIDSGTQPARVESPEPAPQMSVPTPESPPVPTTTATATEDQREKMSRLRRTIAANMSKSWAEIPHVTTFEDVDATRLLETRGALAQRYNRKVPLEALVVRAVLPALDAFPEFNATLDGDELVMHASRDIGIAVDTPDGLLVAVVRDAESKGVLQLADEIVSLGEGARGRSLSVDQLTGQTFTVSNIGAVGGGHGTPIVPYGTTAILSVGRAVEKPVAYNGDLGIAPIMPLSLSYDHRVVDGAQGRRFIALLIENLEEPALFLAT
jgi:pyruvate dehydrogenase E2 component (dihydrolipoamide acetyltransferase)